MKQQIFTALLRIILGWIFLWAFLDKLFGLGFATASDKSWLSGSSPTYGFLKFATHGPFKPLFDILIGSQLVDWLFMLGLLGVGVGLILGIAKKLSVFSGSLMLFLMWSAAFPPQHNPFIDEHVIYILALGLLYQLHSGEIFGLGKWWNKTSLVKRYPFLK